MRRPRPEVGSSPVSTPGGRGPVRGGRGAPAPCLLVALLAAACARAPETSGGVVDVGSPAPARGGPHVEALGAPILVGGTSTLSGAGFTPGSRVMLFVATPNGPVAHGPFEPKSVAPTALSWEVPPTVALGDGFATLLVVNTDEAFRESNVVGQHLLAEPETGIPSLTRVNGAGLEPPDATTPFNRVTASVPSGSTLSLEGTGFREPRVNLFTSAGNLGPLDPVAGGTANLIRVTLPAGTPAGPVAFQVVNHPYTGNVLSNAVSVTVSPSR